MNVVHVYCKAQRADNSRIHQIGVVGVEGVGALDVYIWPNLRKNWDS